MKNILACLGLLTLFVLPTAAQQHAVSNVLDELHAAASAADFDRYFGLYAEGAIFYGTDATERWTLDEFKAYAKPHFDQGRGWTYHMTSRHVYLAPDGQTAWFDETLSNAGLGDTRGSGVLVRQGDAWKVIQYNLTIPIPNELARAFVERIQAEHEGIIVYLVRHAEKANDGTSDPPLTSDGHARATMLASLLVSADITHLHTSNYKRTRQTLAPMAEATGLSVATYDARALEAFAEELRRTPGVHLVAGHSNTTPALVALLGGTPGEPIEESEYDRLYQVIIRPGRHVESTLLHVPPFE